VGNAQAFQTIADKVRSYTAYEKSIGYFASGCSTDFAYGLLGVAGIAFEVGTKFFQDCKTFETSILSQNLPALTYLAKIARAPFRLSKGPDITNLSAVVKGDLLTVNITASDSALSYGGVSTSQQSIRHIRVFLNIHPYSISSSNLTRGYVLQSGIGVIDVSTLTNQTRHVLYAEATDSAGYTGPITAAYIWK
jgi:carboxypeptidase T